MNLVRKYDQGTNSKAWLFKILKNAYINEHRQEDEDALLHSDIDETHLHK